ncbi:HIT family protein [Humidisolicoccus flavus]|uniref:HIT family protein n=1 Tax=Humidisolicoccus flavus TaxID=3111414 RepID=UPI003248FF77
MSKTSIDLPDEYECAFCAYIRGARPYTFVWREERVAVMITREQRGVAHLLVVPIAHVPTLLDLPDESAADVLIAVRDAATTIDRAYERPGLAVWQNNGRSAHQMIPHLHFHVAGTLPEGGTDFGPVEEIPVSATDEIGRRLASHVPARAESKRRVEPRLT